MILIEIGLIPEARLAYPLDCSVHRGHSPQDTVGRQGQATHALAHIVHLFITRRPVPLAAGPSAGGVLGSQAGATGRRTRCSGASKEGTVVLGPEGERSLRDEIAAPRRHCCTLAFSETLPRASRSLFHARSSEASNGLAGGISWNGRV